MVEVFDLKLLRINDYVVNSLVEAELLGFGDFAGRYGRAPARNGQNVVAEHIVCNCEKQR